MSPRVLLETCLNQVQTVKPCFFSWSSVKVELPLHVERLVQSVKALCSSLAAVETPDVTAALNQLPACPCRLQPKVLKVRMSCHADVHITSEKTVLKNLNTFPVSVLPGCISAGRQREQRYVLNLHLLVTSRCPHADTQMCYTGVTDTYECVADTMRSDT